MTLDTASEGLTRADTWFFESLQFDLSATLTLRIVEGLRTGERKRMDLGGKSIGPYEVVAPAERSRVLDLVFKDVWAYDLSREGRERAPEGQRIWNSDFLSELPDDAFDHLLTGPLMRIDKDEYALRRWFVWTEDYVIYVISRAAPDIRLSNEGPDLKLDRGETFFA